jgi:Fur family transcriptional regulator, ferric uptake regulator
MTGIQQDSLRNGTSIRATRQGEVVVDALAQTDAFISAQDLHARMKQGGTPVGLATIYRHLQVLADRGRVDVLRTADGQSMYRACATDRHHHHLVCRQCGRTVELVAASVERWAEKAASAEGFVDVEHTLEIFGTCAQCVEGLARP